MSLSFIFSEEDIAHMEESPIARRSSPLDASDAAKMSTEHILDELSFAAKRQAVLVTQLVDRRVEEAKLLEQKEQEISLLRAQLADQKAKTEAASLEAKEFAVKSEAAAAELSRERNEAAQFRAGCQAAMATLEAGIASHTAEVDSFRGHVKDALAGFEQKIQALSSAYHEELYPVLTSTVAERR